MLDKNLLELAEIEVQINSEKFKEVFKMLKKKIIGLGERRKR